MKKPKAILKKLSIILSALLLCCNVINAADIRIATGPTEGSYHPLALKICKIYECEKAGKYQVAETFDIVNDTVSTDVFLLSSTHVNKDVVAKLALILQQNIKEIQKSYPAVINFSNLKSGEDSAPSKRHNMFWNINIPFHEGVKTITHKPNNKKRK